MPPFFFQHDCTVRVGMSYAKASVSAVDFNKNVVFSESGLVSYTFILSDIPLVFVRKRCYFSLQKLIRIYHAKH